MTPVAGCDGEMLDLINFGLDMAVCIVNAMVFNKSNFATLFRISFIEFLKGTTIFVIISL